MRRKGNVIYNKVMTFSVDTDDMVRVAGKFALENALVMVHSKITAEVLSVRYDSKHGLLLTLNRNARINRQ